MALTSGKSQNHWKLEEEEEEEVACDGLADFLLLFATCVGMVIVSILWTGETN